MGKVGRGDVGSFAHSNDIGTRELFYQRFLYKNAMLRITERHPHFVNFKFGEKFMYGRVDQFSSPIILNNSPNRQSFPAKAMPDSNSTYEALDFVVEAFVDMMKSFDKARLIEQIDSNSTYMANLRVHKAYEDPRQKYNEYNAIFSRQIKTEFMERNIQVLNFREFVEDFKGVILSSGEGVSRYPYTMPGWIKSRLCPITCSGLAIEIASLNASDDSIKSSYMNDVNWDFFMNACNDHGFMIDQDVPWRIVADIDTEVMQDRAGESSRIDLIRNRYIASHLDYFSNFIQIMLNLYNFIKQDVYRQVEFCQKGTIINKLVYPQEYTVSDLGRIYGDEYFIRLYFEIRFAEEESKYTHNEKNNLIHQTIQAFRADGNIASAVFMLERILNKSFDYSRSVSYIINRRKLIKDANWQSEHFMGDRKSDNSDPTGGGGY